jgi:hypothetical protein
MERYYLGFLKPHTLKIILFFLVLGSNSLAQIRISGFVRDSLTHEVLIGSHIIDGKTQKAIASDNNGFFSISVKDAYGITVSYVGYNPKMLLVDNMQDTLIEVLLAAGSQIDEVVVKHTKRPTFNMATLSNMELQKIPSLGAKPDVMKAIQLLPGIQSQNEGSSLIMVRGGNPGENLYLFDNVSLIYVNHLGGFMSVFNPDMINNIDVYKGGFPSRFGGKLSSIMDITQREGNPNAIKGNFSVGVTDASFLVEGPTPLDNTSFLLTGRKTLIDPLMALASKLSGGSDHIVSYGFHDINGKLTWRPNSRNTVSINLYQGDDYLNFWYNHSTLNATEKARMANLWGNWLLSVRWNRVHSPRLYSNQSFSYVRYRLSDRQKFFYKGINEGYEFNRRYLSSVQDISYKAGFKYDISNYWGVDFGFHSSWLQHKPNSTFVANRPLVSNESAIQSLESAMYIDNGITPMRWLDLRIGARLASFFSTSYASLRAEPRFNINITLNEKHSLNTSYMDVNQYSHLLFTAGNIMSNEVWVPASSTIPPSRTKQITAGWRSVFHDAMFNVEISLFHKTLSDLATYREGFSSLMGDENWRAKVESGGKGLAYGTELFLRKNHGKWTGFASYTWSKATRTYTNINNGDEFLFDYDRPHSCSISINRKYNDRISFNLTWVFQSGLPFTPVIGKQLIPSAFCSENGYPFFYEAFIYGERNSVRMRSYHRLDLALHYNTYSKRSGYKTQWSFALYNAYNRRNPYYYYFTHGSADGWNMFPTPSWANYEPFSLYQICFFPIIPTVSYKIIFDENRVEPIIGKGKKSFLKRLIFH